MAGLGLTQINSLLSSQAMLKHTSDLSRNRNMIKGEMGVLNIEIKIDQGRGIDTSAKEERVSGLENSSNNLMDKIAENMDKLNDKIVDDNEKITKEKAEEKSKEKGATEGAKSTASSSDGTHGIGGTHVKSIDGDTVDISGLGGRMVDSEAFVLPEAPLPQPTPVGKIINIKA